MGRFPFSLREESALKAIQQLGGSASAKEIAKRLGWDLEETARILGSLARKKQLDRPFFNDGEENWKLRSQGN